MKKNLKIFLGAGLIFSLASCASTEKTKTEQTVIKTETPAVSKAETEMVSDTSMAQPSVTGTVTEIQNGKDGYTARLLTADGKEFYATISRANLFKPETYRSAKTGDMLTVTGDHWQMEGKDQITVHEIK